MGVVGGGLMGSGIAEMGARAGIDTVVVEVDGDAAVRARQRVEASMARALRSAKLTEEAVESARGLLRYTADYEALRDRELIVEAVFEAESEKIKVFSALDRMVDSPSVILASNTSSIPIMKLAMATQRPASVIGIHFFNPVPVLKLVELVTSLLTADETAARAEAFATGQLGKLVIRSRDRAGFIVNALLIPYLLSAVRMLESGFATREDIDAGMVEGCAHPMGPLALTDLIGLDTTMAWPSRSTRSSRSRCMRRPHSCREWLTPACSAARRVAASTSTGDQRAR